MHDITKEMGGDWEGPLPLASDHEVFLRLVMHITQPATIICKNQLQGKSLLSIKWKGVVLIC